MMEQSDGAKSAASNAEKALREFIGVKTKGHYVSHNGEENVRASGNRRRVSQCICQLAPSFLRLIRAFCRQGPFTNCC